MVASRSRVVFYNKFDYDLESDGLLFGSLERLLGVCVQHAFRCIRHACHVTEQGRYMEQSSDDVSEYVRQYSGECAGPLRARTTERHELSAARRSAGFRSVTRMLKRNP